MNKILEKISCIFLILFTALLYFGYLGSLDLWNPDEPRYVEVAREMLALKNFIVPHLNGIIYSHKPPLFFWSIAGFFTLFGEFKEWIARLTPAISGFLTVIVTYFYASKIFNKKTGFYSALILVTTFNMFHLSRRCNIDTMFTLLILISIMLLHFGVINKEKRTIFFLLSCFFQGLGVITKGPLAFIFPFFTLIGYGFFTNNKELFKTAPWVRGFLVIAAVTALWLLPAGLLGGKEYIDAIMFKHTVGRYMHGVNHPRSFFYYFYTFPLSFLPWALFFPLIFFKGLFNRRKKCDSRLIWFLCWIFINFIFMCFSTEKRSLYLLPLFPGFAIVSAYYLSEKADSDKYFKIPAVIIACSVILASIALPIIYYKKAGDINVVLTVLSAFGLWGGIFFIKFYNNFKQEYKLLLIALIWGVAIFNVFSFIFPFANQYKSPKMFIERVSKIEKNWDNIVFFNFYNPGFNFYLNKTHINITNNINQLKKFLDRRINVVIVKKQSADYVKPYLKDYIFVKHERVGHRRLEIFKRKKE